MTVDNPLAASSSGPETEVEITCPIYSSQISLEAIAPCQNSQCP